MAKTLSQRKERDNIQLSGMSFSTFFICFRLPTYEPSHYPRAEIEPENADYDIEIVEVKKRLPLDVSVAKPGSNELIDRSNSLSIPTVNSVSEVSRMFLERFIREKSARRNYGS